MYAFSMMDTHSSVGSDEREQSGLPARSTGMRSSTTTLRGTPFHQSFTMYLPPGLYTGMPRASCG
jgi:hypothetical protein